jgi:hypothetical protein
MGLSFSGIRKELASEWFKSLYKELRTECPQLHAFPSPFSLISFFHDAANKEYDRKDAILSFLIDTYRKGDKHGSLAPFFIILFANAIASVYGMAKKINKRLDDEEFFQDVCMILLGIIRESTIIPRKVAKQITNKLKNAAWSLVNKGLSQSRLELPAESASVNSLAGVNEEAGRESLIPDAYALLDELVQRRAITVADKKVIIATVIEGKLLRDVSDPRHYEQAKKRRQRAIFAVKQYLANKLKLYSE